MHHQATPWASIAFVALLLAACSKPEPAGPGVQGAAQAKAPAAAEPAKARVRTACTMVPQAEMSAILGGTVIAAPNERSSGQTQCVYTAAAGISPYAELKVEWGEGKIAMSAVSAANQAEPGITNPLDGLGDQAAQIGPVLMIRSGEDLVTITFSGVADALPKARKVFALVKAAL